MDAIRLEAVPAGATAAEIKLTDPAKPTTGIAVNSTIAWGDALYGRSHVRTFTITNLGTGNLDLSGGVSVTGGNGFTISSQPAVSVLAAGESTTFDVEFLSTAEVGTYSDTVSISTNDSDESPFTFTVSADLTLSTIVDNGDPGFEITGNWNSAGEGYGNDSYYRSGGLEGESNAIWEFSGLAAGTYRLSSTWNTYYNRTSSAAFTMSGVNGGDVTTYLDQRTLIVDVTDAGRNWEDLGYFEVDANGTITVTLSGNDTDGTVFVDAIRLEAVPVVNVDPTLDDITDPAAIDSDAGQQVINLSGITAGGSESQTLTVTASSDNPSLIPDPIVNYISPDSTATLTFTPQSNLDDTAVITVTVTDEEGGTISKTFIVTVNAVNTAPVASDELITATEDGSTVMTGVLALDVDSDDDENSLSYTIVTQPAEGSVISNGDGTFTFDPESDFQNLATGETRQVTFTFTATDSHAATSNIGSVTVTVTGVNDTPTVSASVSSGGTDADGAYSLNLLAGASDVDVSDVLNVSGLTLVSGDASGISVNGNALEIDPYAYSALNVGQSEVISYSYNVIDGNGGTVSQTATITISGVNNAPVAVADAFTTSEGVTLTSDNVLSANPTTADSDAEGQTLTVSAVAGGTVGAQFTLASGALLTLNSDGTFSYDPNGQFEYLSLGEAATDSFTYTISDTETATDTATVTVTITGVNAAPTVSASVSSGVTDADGAYSLNLLTGASDVDVSDVLNVSGLTLVSGDASGITVNGNALEIDPYAYSALNMGQSEVISYSYNVIDGNGGTVSQTATITISGVNNAPVAVADAFTTSEGVTLTSDNVLSANPTTADSDAEGQTLTVSAVAGGTVGAQFTLASGALLTLNSDGTFSYDPNGQFEYLSLGEAATDSFTYTISDTETATDTATVTVTITGVNAAPTLGAAIGSTVNENDIAFNLNLLAGASDVDVNDVLNVSGLTLISGDAAGITVNGNTLDVDPDAYAGLYTGETEVVSYSYIVTDSNGGTVSQTATITIAGVDDVPTVSAALSSTVTENDGTYSLDLLAGAEDTDANDTLNVSSLTLLSGNAAGITVNGNTLDIDPGVYNSLAEGESEVVSYSYSVTDANGNTVVQTATISIAGVNDTPTVGAALSSTVTEEAGAYSLNLLSDAVDADTNDSLNVSGLTLVSGDAAGITVNGNTLEIDPGAYTSLAEEESEVISYSYNVIDGNGGTVAQTATITITGLNNTPTVSAELSSSVTEDDGVFSLDLLSGASDIDLSDSLNISGLVLVSGDATGVTVNGNMLDINPIIYTSLNTGESAVISYSYDIVDGNGGTVAQTATITITGMNDNPTVSAALSSTVTEDDGSFSLDLLAGASDADANATLNVSGLTLVSGDAAGITVNGNTLEIDPNAYNNLVQGATEVVTYSYNIIDGDGGSTAQAATITITGVQDPGIHVIDETGELTNGSANLNFGRIYFNESATRTITISNSGIDPLDLSGGISILGGNGFTLVSQPAVSSLDPGESTTFEIQFDAGATQGTFADTVTILSNDPNQGTFTFDISATVIYVNIIDNGDAGYSTTGTWGYITATWDYGGDRNYIIHTSSPGTGANTATWSFSGLAAGYYRLSGNLPTGSLYTPHAEYTISGVVGGDDFLVIDQSDTEINGYYEDYHWGETNLYGGHYFQDFGYYKVEEGGTLSVTLTDNNVQGNVIAHAGYVLADAMRLEALVDVPATIEVFEGSQVIVDDTVSKDMDAVFFGESTTKTFTILNSGASTLDLSNGVTLTGTSGFSIASQPAVTSLAAGESTTFVVQFDADFEFDFEVGSPWAEFTETVTIPNSIQPEEPFTFDITATISSEKIIDDGDPGFSTTGTWTYGTNSDYFEDDILSVSSGGTGLNTATWEFTDLNEGTYRVSGTWFTYWNRASNAKYTISGIVGGDVEVTVDQHWIVNFIKDEGTQWQDFGYFEVESGGTLSITLTDEDANGVIGADAFRIGRVPAVIPEIGVYDSDTELENGASTVDFGTVHLGETVTRTITINNTGTNTLDLSNGISVAGGSGFVITSQPVSALFAGQSTTFEIAFTAGTEADDLSDTVTILSNDYFEELFTFDLTATANYLKIIDNEDAGYSTTGSWL